jgi:acyl-CoA dehydrogenase family protein 9
MTSTVPEAAAAESGNGVSGPSSFTKSLFLGQVAEDMAFPYPALDVDEEERVRELVDGLDEFAAEAIDGDRIEEQEWIGDDVVRGLGDLGLLGLQVPARYGGLGLSQTATARVFERLAQIDGSVCTVLGVHQSIGLKGILMFGSDEQKARFLPDLAAGRKLAGFALTEPGAGSDAYHLDSRATLEPDGSWRLSGEKRFIGNGSKGSVFVTFARTEIDGKDRQSAFILEKGTEGFEVGHRYRTLGLRGNDLRHLYFNDVRVPRENVLGEPGDGFRIAMEVLNSGRLSLATGALGAAKVVIDETVEHVLSRQQFGRPIGEFELVQEKIGWMVTNLFALESMAYLTAGLVDAGVKDTALESAMCKIATSEFAWYLANRALQLKGGAGYTTDEPHERILRDVRILPIFEGANDVLRSYVALSGVKPLADRLKGLTELSLAEPLNSLGVVAEYVAESVRRKLRSPAVEGVHPELEDAAGAMGNQVAGLHEAAAGWLRRENRDAIERQLGQKRLADAVTDIYAQIAVLSRATSLLEEQAGEPAGRERYVARAFCEQAAARVQAALDGMERNDDERMLSVARLAYRGARARRGFFAAV